MLGWDLLGWQRQVASVASELTPEGRWRYPTVVLSVPRQVGKTTLVFSVGAQRSMQLEDHRGWYTAQTGMDARRTFRDEWVPTVQGRMPGLWKARLAGGGETLTFPATRSHWRVFPPGRAALHGTQTDMVVVDEAWAHDLEVGDALWAAIVPTQTTRRRRQTWIVSTAGPPESVWARRWIERGRKAEPGVAYFEWGAEPDADYDDPEVWAGCHPAIGELVTMADLQDFRQSLGREGFARAFLNVWPELPLGPDQLTPVIDPGWWAACKQPGSAIVGPVTFAADCDPLTNTGVIGAVGMDAYGRQHLELVRSEPGALWLPGALARLADTHNGLIAADEGGPVGWVGEDVARRGYEVAKVRPSDYARACTQMLEDIRGGLVSHGGDARLDVAAASAQRAPMGGAWRWDRSRSPGDIAPLIACTLAYAVAVTHAVTVEPSRIF